MTKNHRMKKRLFALCMALMAFLAMPLTAGAALNSVTDTLDGYGVRGALYDYELYAQAFTECQKDISYTEIYVDLYCFNGRDIKTPHSSSCNNKTTSTTVFCPDYRYTVQKAISTHYVKLGKDHEWKYGLVSFYNGK